MPLARRKVVSLIVEAETSVVPVEAGLVLVVASGGAGFFFVVGLLSSSSWESSRRCVGWRVHRRSIVPLWRRLWRRR